MCVCVCVCVLCVCVCMFCVCVCVCVCVLCQSHQVICMSFDGKTQDVFGIKAISKICSHVVRPDRSLSLFYSLPQAKCRDRSPTAGTTLAVILLNTFFNFYKRLLPNVPEHAVLNTVISHKNSGRKCTKYFTICNY